MNLFKDDMLIIMSRIFSLDLDKNFDIILNIASQEYQWILQNIFKKTFIISVILNYKELFELIF